jgi:hypothetical protein
LLNKDKRRYLHPHTTVNADCQFNWSSVPQVAEPYMITELKHTNMIYLHVGGTVVLKTNVFSGGLSGKRKRAFLNITPTACSPLVSLPVFHSFMAHRTTL